LHKNFVLRTILEYKKIGFHVRIVYTVNDLGLQGTVNVLYGTTRYVWLLGRVWGASFEAILQKFRILDIKKN
jgi:hypothetical protein